jgi:hypothetical protein
MPHTTILFVHLQYDAPDSPQSRALRALAATVVRTMAPPLYLVGGYAYDDFDTDSLPLAVAQAVSAAEALQGALPCPVRRAIPPAVGYPKSQAQDRSTLARVWRRHAA